MTATDTGARLMLDTRTFDSSRWDRVKLRDDDIIVATWAKAGTTLTQQMVWQLITGGADGVASLAVSPWVEVRFGGPVEAMAAMLEAQSQRRVLKTHSPFEAVPFRDSIKYVYIGRDGRDVMWSAYNHLSSFSDAALENINALEGPWPKQLRPEMGERAYYLQWLDGNEAYEGQGPSFWDNVNSWWDQRRRPNVLLLHYANIIADLAGELRRLAAFLEIPVDEARLPLLVEHCGIDYMRDKAKGSRLDIAFKGGAASFFNKGSNGRWKDVLSPAEIARCDEVAARHLPSDCAHWLKTGELPG
ncbi:MAG TPA: sulfotransferase domain-containing protein [Caulobacteraceae bacterium]|nr:sulfotransferase domain-containing protein [Caulobacteraceae bacterium]